MKNQIPAIIILIALLTACVPQPTSTPAPAEISTSPAPAASATSTVELSTATPKHVLAPRAATWPTATKTTIEECIPLEQKIPDDLVLPGVWITNEATPYLEDLATHTKNRIPLKGGGVFSTENGNMAVSPDGTHIAYIDPYHDQTNVYLIKKRVLRIVDSTGQSLDLSYWKETWQWLIGWADNQNLVIATGNKDIMILNPFTGSRKKFEQPEWVNFNNSNNRNRGSVPDYPMYDPTLTWILEHPDYGNWDLKNVKTGETIWKANNSGTYDWSWDITGTISTIIVENSITVINNGKQDASYDVSSLKLESAFPASLSPDGRKLAFTSSKNNKGQLTTLDLTQRKFNRLCANEFESIWTTSIWSPDSRFVIQETRNARSIDFADILLDTQTMRAYLLNFASSQLPIAWLAKP